MTNKHIYIVLTRTNTFISKMIRLFKQDEFTHAAISLDRELTQMYSFGRRWKRVPFWGCFRREEAGKGVYALFHDIPCVVLEVDVTAEQHQLAHKLLEDFIKWPSYYGYNYWGLVGNALGISIPVNRRFLCSEFVYHICKESGIVSFDIPSTLVRPQNLLTAGRIIYEGNLNALRPAPVFRLKRPAISR